MPKLISRKELDVAFDTLSEELIRRETEAMVVLFGDAAMMFAHDARSAISHVDAAPKPRGIVLGAARDAGQLIGLPAHWINDQATSKLPKYIEDDVVGLFERPNLRVTVLGPELLLAMAALAPNRPEDIDDITLLAELLGITSSIDVEVLVAELFPGRSLSAKAREVLDDLL